ncbi:unnamed protein product [Rotaria sordida]|uniref:Protein kinase domain-containing protein n=1 Tax=Rotaria sordida TaxID=392033 RepID=A0A814SVW2_9BILA|nr:unnamed protein product [Rotaria sordida]
MNNRTSLATLKRQTAYTLDVDIRKGEKITGAFGKTFYRANWINQEDSPIVLLEMKVNKTTDEALLYISLHHPHIIKTYGLVEPNGHIIGSDSILLLQEYAEDGDLGILLSERYFIPSQYVLLEIFIQISSAMIYLSENGIIHGDLACRNALVFQSHPYEPKQNLVKLIDFGLTRDDSIPKDVKIHIPIRYVAKEILLSQGRSNYSQKSDVYSFGVLMWEACSFGAIPYVDINDDQEVSQRKLQDKKLTRPNKCDSNIWKLMNICWNDKPYDRPNFDIIHTQLMNIKNIQSSSTSSLTNSILSSSRMNEKNPCLFEIEYETCNDCGLRYTDYDSHSNKCNTQKLTCFQCDQQYQRAIYDDHMKTCARLSKSIISRKPTLHNNSYISMNEENLLFCEYCLVQYSIDEINNHENCFRDKQQNRKNRYEIENTRHSIPFEISSQSSSHQNINQNNIHVVSSDDNISPTNARRLSVRNNIPKPTTTRLPCEICNRPIDESEFKTHQKQCMENDRRRIEDKRRKIEQSKSTIEVECTFCNGKYSTEELDNHQNNCRLNLMNVSDTLSIQSRKESTSIPNTDFHSENTTNTTQPKPVDNKTTTSTANKNKQLSCFQKFLSRLLSFTRKS